MLLLVFAGSSTKTPPTSLARKRVRIQITKRNPLLEMCFFFFLFLLLKHFRLWVCLLKFIRHRFCCVPVSAFPFFFCFWFPSMAKPFSVLSFESTVFILRNSNKMCSFYIPEGERWCAITHIRPNAKSPCVVEYCIVHSSFTYCLP